LTCTRQIVIDAPELVEHDDGTPVHQNEQRAFLAAALKHCKSLRTLRVTDMHFGFDRFRWQWAFKQPNWSSDEATKRWYQEGNDAAQTRTNYLSRLVLQNASTLQTVKHNCYSTASLTDLDPCYEQCIQLTEHPDHVFMYSDHQHGFLKRLHCWPKLQALHIGNHNFGHNVQDQMQSTGIKLQKLEIALTRHHGAHMVNTIELIKHHAASLTDVSVYIDLYDPLHLDQVESLCLALEHTAKHQLTRLKLRFLRHEDATTTVSALSTTVLQRLSSVSVDVDSGHPFTDLPSLVKLWSEYSRNLEELRIDITTYDNVFVQDGDWIKPLSQLRRMKTLCIGDSSADHSEPPRRNYAIPFDDRDCGALATMPHLERVMLRCTKITRQSVPVLSQRPLKHLDIGYTRLAKDKHAMIQLLASGHDYIEFSSTVEWAECDMSTFRKAQSSGDEKHHLRFGQVLPMYGGTGVGYYVIHNIEDYFQRHHAYKSNVKESIRSCDWLALLIFVLITAVAFGTRRVVESGMFQ